MIARRATLEGGRHNIFVYISVDTYKSKHKYMFLLTLFSAKIKSVALLFLYISVEWAEKERQLYKYVRKSYDYSFAQMMTS